MRRNDSSPFIFILIALFLIIALSGSAAEEKETPKTAVSHVNNCKLEHGSKLHGIGECIEQEYGNHKTATVPDTSSVPSQCVDISNWQGVPNLSAAKRAGIRCVIIQTNDAGFHNPFLAAQVAEAKSAHMPFGFYTFTEAGSGEYQAAVALSLGQKYHPQLGYWTDVEVPGSYSHACSYVNYIKRHGVAISGVYASPGNYNGGRCAGYIWPAEWGSGKAYPLSGYPASAIKLRQWCGTCSLHPAFSGAVDRDESLGLLSLAEPKPKPIPTYQLVEKRLKLRFFLTKHHCRQPPYHAAKPPRYEHACHTWLNEGAAIGKLLKARAR